jgi:phosphopantetheinyl transferase
MPMHECFDEKWSHSPRPVALALHTTVCVGLEMQSECVPPASKTAYPQLQILFIMPSRM